MGTPRLPDFVIIGAPRAATTSLNAWLDAHPQCQMATPKELEFFSRWFDRGVDWYREQFAAPPAMTVGEATPAYLAHELAVDRIVATLPATRFIATLRDPVQRAWSHYWLGRGMRLETRTFEAALGEELESGDPHSGYLGHGLYGRHLRRWVDAVGSDRLLILTFDEVAAQPLESYRRVCGFLELDDQSLPHNVGTVHNARYRVRSQRLRALILRFRLGRRVPWLFHRLDRLNSAKLETPAMPAELERRLREWYSADLAQLGEIIDVPPVWSSGRTGEPAS